MPVEFDEDNLEQNKSAGKILYGHFQRSTHAPGMVTWLLKKGVKTESIANTILLCVVITFILLSIGVYYFLSFPVSVKHNVYHKKTYNAQSH